MNTEHSTISVGDYFVGMLNPTLIQIKEEIDRDTFVNELSEQTNLMYKQTDGNINDRFFRIEVWRFLIPDSTMELITELILNMVDDRFGVQLYYKVDKTDLTSDRIKQCQWIKGGLL